jgi:hypothetical protein
MNKTKYTIMMMTLLSAIGATGKSQKPQTLRTFSTSDPTISKDLRVTDDKAWLADCAKPLVIRLFEIANPGVEDCMVIYRAKLKSEGLEGQAYLEMWCRFSGKGEFFSRGLQNPLSGSNEWASYETPFFLEKGENPDLIKINLVVKGTGKVLIKDVELLKASLPSRK